MVLARIRDAIQGKPKLDGEARLPEYFPVQPSGCERHADKLFKCLSDDATSKARDMETAGLHKSYYPDVEVKPMDDEAAKRVEELAKSGENVSSSVLPKAGDNPLEECRDFIAYYKRCCDRELKKKKNWILTEPYRVQEEYRYKQNSSS
uniref:Uncharacterized protein n=1 Tax=Chaetoceros debilis TaxID=122233 RepID=A0A7S3VDW0_9STRA|mmetsp:Transcript_6765/g.9957  ORF Transcript_6765/g.9957 Transcript_6765/m.9957 type:complete len:149 (+) Transcript_6765:94-540(+)|eukprot:CAMPEP_0194099504 /NCGR_PEP_ID=MMETSP0150-20130528/664_1 /TAXON_ID=122233 /ORGANISM="Chaetoceros debilis, Strain MM31A-1" /LENGTH=148 /DNA_ID=CAMNT_0038785721 /DNA_START=85 /DNA_END=531 /DNA_ORIENTATION=+